MYLYAFHKPISTIIIMQGSISSGQELGSNAFEQRKLYEVAEFPKSYRFQMFGEDDSTTQYTRG